MSRIAIISDTHSRYDFVETAVKKIDAAQVEFTIHCGDIEDSETVWLFQPNTHFVFGNCDHDRASLRQAIHGIGATLHEPYGMIEHPLAQIAFLHGDDANKLTDLEWMDHFDYLFHGHSHIAGERRRGKTRIINPGALHRVRQKTFAILDLATGELESVLVD